MRETYRETIEIRADDQSARGVESAQRRVSALERTVRGIGRLTIRPVVSIIDRATAPLRGIMSAARGLTGALGAIGLAGIGIQAIGSAFQSLGNLVGVGVASSFEQLQAQMMAFLKDGDAVTKVMADLQAEAAKTPFSLQDMGAAAAALIPALRGTGLELMDVMRTAEILGSLNPAEGLAGASFAIREFMAGDVTSLADRFNISRVALNKLKDEGVPAIEAINRVLSDMGVDYDLVAKQGETFSGRMSTLIDTIDQVKLALSAAIFDRLKAGLAALQVFLDANIDTIKGYAATVGTWLGGAFETVRDTILNTVGTLLRYGRALGILDEGAEGLAGSLFGLRKPLTPIEQLLRKMRGPLGMVVAGVTALFTAITRDSGALGVIGDLVEKAFGPRAASLIRPFLEVGMRIIKTIKSIITSVTALAEGRMSFSTFTQWIAVAVLKLGDTLVHEVGQLASRVADGAAEMLGGLIQGARDWANGPGPGEVATALQNLGSRAWEWIGGAAGDVGAFLQDNLVTPIAEWAGGDGPGRVRDALFGLAASAWAWLKGAGESAWMFLEQNIIQPIIGWVEGGGIQRTIDALAGLAAGAWAWITNAVSDVGAFLEPLLAAMKEWVETVAAPALEQAARSLGSTIATGVQTGWAEMQEQSTFLHDLAERLKEVQVPESVTRSLDNLATSLSVVLGWLEKVRDGAQNVIDKLAAADGPSKTTAAAIDILAGAFQASAIQIEKATEGLKNILIALDALSRWLNQNPFVMAFLRDPVGASVAAITNQTGAGPAAGNAGAAGPSVGPTGVVRPVGAAAGGIVTSEQLVRVGEGNRPEAIIPLDRLASRGGDLGGINLGGVSIAMTFSGEAPKPEDARALARRLAPELAAQLARELRRARPGLVRAL